jgi:2-keto-4-pentenoate hydratase
MMTEQQKVARIARRIFEGHEQRQRFERLRGELAPASLDEAYDVQDEVHRLFKEAGWGELAGHKIALTSKAVQELCGVAGAVGACMPAFELIEDRGADYGDLDAASILTDKCWCGGVVLGPEIADWRGLDLERAPALLSWNGEVVDQGVTGAAMGHPFEGLAWLANLLAGRGRAMKAGEIVITGSALRTRFPEAGDEVTYRIAGLGETSVRVTP